MNPQGTIITRASGKVLIAGGYGVLQQNNVGLSLALTNSLYCICEKYESEGETDIRVRSPQLDGSWEYRWCKQQKKLYEISDKQNVFVFNAILWTLIHYKRQANAGSIYLKIISDRGFLSDADALDQHSRFPKYRPGFRKTGLGSSACVLVSIVKCLVKLMGFKEKKYLRLVNVISQTANLSAQKKIGSNFDISTAVFGTHLYKNIFPNKIFKIIEGEKDKISESIQKLLEIDPEIRQVPNLADHSLFGYIIDIKKGADTRVMVSGFISKLKLTSESLYQEFFVTSKQITHSLYQALIKLQINQCRIINQAHRNLQRKYSKITGVPVEPQDLTPLIDRIVEIPEVCYCICPGSGGYDAVFVLGISEIGKRLAEVVKGQHEVREVELLLGEKEDQLNEQLIKQLSGLIQI